MKQILFFFTAILLILSGGCKKETNVYIDPDAPAPAQVNGVKVVSTPGGAIVTYKAPLDSNLLYVKAKYEIRPGVFRVAKASYYTDTLALVGFGDTLTHDVKIYSVGRNGKESAPTSLQVKPLIPPVRSVFKSLTLTSTFGGIYVTFKDSTQADLAIVVMMDTTGLGTWTPVTTYYTAEKEGSFAGRGLDTLKRKFAVFVRDHWNNKSDTLFKIIKPLFEELIPKNTWKIYPLPGDYWKNLARYPVTMVWDGIVNTHEDIFAVPATAPFPSWFTVDMGVKVVFSRMKLFQRLPYPFNAVWVKKFAIWGSNNPNSDGSWGNWHELGVFDFRKPSGLPGQQYTADDLAYVAEGEDFLFPAGLPAYRFFRFELLDTYGHSGKYQLGELTFWGQIVP